MPSQFFASGSRSPQSASLNSAICYLPDDEFVEQLRKLNGTPADILDNSGLMSVLLPTIRSDIEIALKYHHEFRNEFQCNLTILGGDKDFVTEQSLQEWSENFSHTESITIFSGDHFFINSHKNAVLDKINSVLYQLTP